MFASTLALFVLSAPAAQAAETEPPKLKRPVLAAGLNWFLPGAGYAYNNQKPLYVTVPMMAGAVGLTYVENFHQFENGTLREQDPMAFGVLFGSVIVLNTGAAIDAFREARAINRAGVASWNRERELELSLAPTVYPSQVEDQAQANYGLLIDGRF